MGLDAKEIPAMPDWPYVGIATSLCEFQATFRKEPSALVVGSYLWESLKLASENGNAFRVYGGIPIHLDITGLLESKDFIFTY
jgi:hypothetical protein